MPLFSLVISFLLIFLIFHIQSYPKALLRSSFIASSITIGLLIILSTEFLSVFNLIRQKQIFLFWNLIILAAIFALSKLIYKKSIKTFISLNFPKLSRLEIVILFSMVFIIVTTGIIALISPPNSWDSMTYHMSRVMHWIQNNNVKHYPTHILRQLHQTPGAEFTIMHLQILNGTDRFANFVQWFSMAGSVIGISLIAKLLGANKYTQFLAAALVTTIPMGILQSSSTLNDYAVSFWLVCFVYYFLLFKNNQTLSNLLGMSVSLGLALVTKATAYIYVFPFLIWLLMSKFKNMGFKFLLIIFIMGFITLIINIGHYIRNFELYKNPLGPCYEEHANNCKYRNEIFTFPALASNIIRNVSLHIKIPRDIAKKIDANKKYRSLILAKAKNLHNFLGIDINDPRTTWSEKEFEIKNDEFYEGNTSNLLHFCLIIVSISIFFFSGNLNKKTDITNYLTAIIAGSLLFCFYLKWQPWHSRLHLPLFVLWCAFIATVLSQNLNYKIINLIIVTVILASFPWVFQNQNRKFVGANNIFSKKRADRLFSQRPYLRIPYLETSDYIIKNGHSNLGLDIGSNDWEYPLWPLLKNNNSRIRLEHIDIKNISKTRTFVRPFNNFIPEAIISINQKQDNDEIILNEIIYRKAYEQEYVYKERLFTISIFTR